MIFNVYYSFRVVTYNILADVYGSTDYSKYTLYPYCSQEHLSADYRRLIISKELTCMYLFEIIFFGYFVKYFISKQLMTES